MELSVNDPGFLVLVGYRGDWKPRTPVMLPELREKHEAVIREEAARVIPIASFDRRHKFRRPLRELPPAPPPRAYEPPLVYKPLYTPPEPVLPPEPPRPPELPPRAEAAPDSFSDLVWDDGWRERTPEERDAALVEGGVKAR